MSANLIQGIMSRGIRILHEVLTKHGKKREQTKPVKKRRSPLDVYGTIKSSNPPLKRERRSEAKK